MKPIWHLFYKEWIKTRAAFFGTLIVGIGVVFGYLPARRAARLNPIEALRYE